MGGGDTSVFSSVDDIPGAELKSCSNGGAEGLVSVEDANVARPSPRSSVRGDSAGCVGGRRAPLDLPSKSLRRPCARNLASAGISQTGSGCRECGGDDAAVDAGRSSGGRAAANFSSVSVRRADLSSAL